MTDSAVADHAASDRSTRRSLLGAGVIGAALAVASSRAASAASDRFTNDELVLLAFAISLELAARDLYDEAIGAGADDDLWRTLREQHEAYAHRLAGITGISADQRNDDTFEAWQGAFATAEPVDAGYDLESALGATHTELLGSVEQVDAAEAIASFIALEARHATILAIRGGRGDDLNALFLNTASPLAPETP